VSSIYVKNLVVLQRRLSAVKHTKAKFMSRFKSVLLVALACQVATQPTAASQVTNRPAIPGFQAEWNFYEFDFTAFPLGTTTEFSETVGGLTITYSAPNDPFAFRTVDSGDIPATSSPFPWLLGDAGSSVLEISLSHPVFGIGVEFLTLGGGPILMDLLSDGLDGTLVGGIGAVGGTPPGLIYPEGFASLLPVCVCANYFDAVRLSDLTDPSFAVHRIVVARRVPEPPMFAILGIGLVALMTVRRSKRQ
jgi:hypothetical protein